MLFIITGLSGAGKSTALHALEDLGFFCTDNLPITMLPHWAENMMRNENDAAVCVDIRSAENPNLLHQALASIRKDLPWKIVFIEANDEVIRRRYSTLRRIHPHGHGESLEQAIASERVALQPLLQQADEIVDSSHMTPYQLSDAIEDYWRSQHGGAAERREMICSLVSFSYQRGLPSGADMVVDMRFLPNPHYKPELAALTGKDKAVQDFFAPMEDVHQAEKQIQDWLLFIWPRLKQERKSYFTLAFGCSGGRHRSVYMAERIAGWLQKEKMSRAMVRHRELGEHG